MDLRTVVIVGMLYSSSTIHSHCYMYGEYDISEQEAKNCSELMQIWDEQLCELFRKKYTKKNLHDSMNLTNLLENYLTAFNHLLIIYRIEREYTHKYIEPIIAQGGPKYWKIKFDDQAAMKNYGWTEKFTNFFMKTLNETEVLWITCKWFVKNPLEGTPRSPYFTTENSKFVVIRI